MKKQMILIATLLGALVLLGGCNKTGLAGKGGEITFGSVANGAQTRAQYGDDFTNPNEPILVMDGTVSADGDILTIYPTPSVLNSYTPGTGNNPTTNNIGNFTLAPMHGADVTNGIPADEIQMTAYFTLDDGSNYYHCVYNGDPAEISNRVNNGSILRGRRTYLAIDLYTAGGAQKTTLLYVD